MRQFDYAIFDLDGTLLDTREGVVTALVRVMKEERLPVPSQDELERLIGPPVQCSFKKLFSLSDETAMEMSDVFRDYYKTDEFLLRAEPYEGIYKLFEDLTSAGVKVGIATYKREDYAKKLLFAKKFNEYTGFMYGADFEGRLKKKDIIKKCLKDMGCENYAKAVYIGDSESDGEGAVALGMNFIALTYGFGFKAREDAQKFNPIGIAGSCNEVRDLIL